MFDLFKKSFSDFKGSYQKYISFEFLFMLLTSFIFVPVISYVFNRMLKFMGTGFVVNADVYKIGLSYTGIIGLSIIGFLFIIALFIEYGVIIIIAQKCYFNKKILISEAFVTTLKKLPKLLGFGVFQLIIMLLLIIPFIDLSTLPALLDFNIPIFVTSTFYGSHVSLFIYLSVFLLIMYLTLRLLFTLHFIFLEDKSIWKAMKSSFQITKQKTLKLIFNLFLLNITIYLIGFLFITIISFIPTILDSKVIGDLVENYLVTFSSYLTLIFSLLLIPMNIIIITHVFYTFIKADGHEDKDHLTLSENKQLSRFENSISHFFNKRKSLLLTLTVVYLTGMFLINYTVNDNMVYLKWNVSVAGHRGDLHRAPENSLSSIRSAIDKGVDTVEIDVKMTKDGVIVLYHDSDLTRMTGIPTKINDMTYDELSRVDIGSQFSEAFIGEKIPTLDEALEEVKEENVKIIIDVKLDGGSREEFAEKIVDLVEKHEMEDVSYIQSFDYNLLQEVRKKNNTIMIGQIMYIAAGNLGNLDVDFYTINQSMLSERFIRNAQKLNREVWVWTVNIERNMREVLEYDIDGIITDYPEKVHRVLGINFAQE